MTSDLMLAIKTIIIVSPTSLGIELICSLKPNKMDINRDEGAPGGEGQNNYKHNLPQ